MTEKKTKNRKPPAAGKGRPKGARNKRTKLLAALLSKVITNEKREQLILMAYNRAMDGDGICMRLIWEYMWGKPVQPLDIKATVEHRVIPDDELRDIAMRNASRIMERSQNVIDAPVNGN